MDQELKGANVSQQKARRGSKLFAIVNSGSGWFRRKMTFKTKLKLAID